METPDTHTHTHTENLLQPGPLLSLSLCLCLLLFHLICLSFNSPWFCPSFLPLFLSFITSELESLFPILLAPENGGKYLTRTCTNTKTHGQVVVFSVVLSKYKLMVVHTIYVQVFLKKGTWVTATKKVFRTLVCRKHMPSVKRTICHLEWADNSQFFLWFCVSIDLHCTVCLILVILKNLTHYCLTVGNYLWLKYFLKHMNLHLVVGCVQVCVCVSVCHRKKAWLCFIPVCLHFHSAFLDNCVGSAQLW